MSSLLTPALYQKLDIDALNYLIELAIDAERPKDVSVLLMELASKRCAKDCMMTLEELDVFAKNIKTNVRQILNSIDSCPVNEESVDEYYKDAPSKEEKHVYYKNSLKKKLTEELHTEVKKALSLLSDRLIPIAREKQEYHHELTYYRLCGDFHRYMCCYSMDDDDEKKADRETAAAMYLKAIELAEEHCTENDVRRLVCVQNYCVFLFDVAGDKQKAIGLLESTKITASKGLSSSSDQQPQNADLLETLRKMHDTVAYFREQINEQQ